MRSNIFYFMNFREYYQNEIPGKWGNLSYTNSWKMRKLNEKSASI